MRFLRMLVHFFQKIRDLCYDRRPPYFRPLAQPPALATALLLPRLLLSGAAMKFSSTVSRSRRKSRKVCFGSAALSDATRPRRYSRVFFL